MGAGGEVVGEEQAAAPSDRRVRRPLRPQSMVTRDAASLRLDKRSRTAQAALYGAMARVHQCGNIRSSKAIGV
jgi:hypothetical protein